MKPPRYLVPALVAFGLHVTLFLGFSAAPAPSPSTPAPADSAAPSPTDLIEMAPIDPEPATAYPGELAEPVPVALPEPVASTDRVAPIALYQPAVWGRQTVSLRLPGGAPTGWGAEAGAGQGRGAWGVVAAGLLDRTPSARSQVAPLYPLRERQSGREARVLVEFDVDPAGRVLSARVLASGGAEFDAAALRAVRQWRFEPGRRAGRVVPFRMAIPIVFSMETL